MVNTHCYAIAIISLFHIDALFPKVSFQTWNLKPRGIPSRKYNNSLWASLVQLVT